MPLQALYESREAIPEEFRESSLFEERGGQFHMVRIDGLATDADVSRMRRALDSEKNDHAGSKSKLSSFLKLNLSAEELQTTLDRIPELEASAGTMDDEKLQKLLSARMNGKLAPLERELEGLRTGATEKDAIILGFQQENTRRTISDDVRTAAKKLKVLSSAEEDAVMLAERVFGVSEDGIVLTRDNVGVTPGLTTDQWLTDMQEKRPHWWPTTSGGGAPGSKGGPGMSGNPWSNKNWNMTAQGAYIREHGSEKAVQMAKSAGTSVGGKRPVVKS